MTLEANRIDADLRYFRAEVLADGVFSVAAQRRRIRSRRRRRRTEPCGADEIKPAPPPAARREGDRRV